MVQTKPNQKVFLVLQYRVRQKWIDSNKGPLVKPSILLTKKKKDLLFFNFDNFNMNTILTILPMYSMQTNGTSYYFQSASHSPGCIDYDYQRMQLERWLQYYKIHQLSLIYQHVVLVTLILIILSHLFFFFFPRIPTHTLYVVKLFLWKGATSGLAFDKFF